MLTYSLKLQTSDFLSEISLHTLLMQAQRDLCVLLGLNQESFTY